VQVKRFLISEESSLLDCIPHCNVCTDATTCDTCEAGYGLLNDACVICPTGKYLTGTYCRSCPQHCDTCTDSNTCQVCSAGYGFYNGECVACPTGTFLTGTTCTSSTFLYSNLILFRLSSHLFKLY